MNKNPAKTITDNQFETLKDGNNFFLNEVLPQKQVNDNAKNLTPGSFEDENDYRKKVFEKDNRLIGALEEELKMIRRERLFNELVRKIQDNEEVYIDQFSQLTYEQRDVLKAQIEAVRQQKLNDKNTNDKLIEPIAKRGRRLGIFGRKQAAERQQTRVEKPLPVSG